MSWMNNWLSDGVCTATEEYYSTDEGKYIAQTKLCSQPAKVGLEGERKMASLKEAAQAYEPPQAKNIADLDKVSVDISITEASASSLLL